jgi:hypothetical protein
VPDFQGGEEIWLRLRALRDTAPFSVRLRAVLKYMLRACRIRCIEIIDVPAFPRNAEEVVDIDQFTAALGRHAEALRTHQRQHR